MFAATPKRGTEAFTYIKNFKECLFKIGLLVVVTGLSQRTHCDWLVVQALYHQEFFQFPNQIQI